MKPLRETIALVALAGLSVPFGPARADESKATAHRAVAGEARLSATNQVSVTGTVSGDNMLFSQRSGTIVLAGLHELSGGSRPARVDGSFVTLHGPRGGDPGEIALGISSEHGDAAGAALAGADGRMLRYTVLVDGVAVRPDGRPLPVQDRGDKIETTNYTVSFDVPSAVRSPSDDYHDTVTLSIIP